MGVNPMKTQNQNRRPSKHCPLNKARLSACITFAVSTLTAQVMASSTTATAYDENVLFNPSDATLQAEAKGRVTIYDGLEHSVVDHALDTQFGRMESMMFVRTRETLPDGDVEFDDDCD